MKTITDELSAFLKKNGASLVGFADLDEIDAEARDGFQFGISIAVALNPRIMMEITSGPTRRYYDEYAKLNDRLDNLAQSVEQLLRGKGHGAQARRATFEEDKATLNARLPHKTVATRAGLGWIGKCALLVTPKYGSAVRLVTVLTDAPLLAGKPIDSSSCGDCSACVDACPAGALTGKTWQSGIKRESIFNAFACRDAARDLSFRNFGVKVTLCGRCIVACPWTQQYLKSDQGQD